MLRVLRGRESDANLLTDVTSLICESYAIGLS